MRTQGSCRFKPYFKIQFRNEFLAWQDLQKSYATAAEAKAEYPPGKICRLMLVTEKGRQPYVC